MKKIIIPDSDKIGILIIRRYIKHCKNDKLYGIQEILNKSLDLEVKEQLQPSLDKEYIKRGIKKI